MKYLYFFIYFFILFCISWILELKPSAYLGLTTTPSHDRDCRFFTVFSNPQTRIPGKSMVFIKSYEHISILMEIGFQKLHIGRGSVLTKNERVSSPFTTVFVDIGATLFAKI